MVGKSVGSFFHPLESCGACCPHSKAQHDWLRVRVQALGAFLHRPVQRKSATELIYIGRYISSSPPAFSNFLIDTASALRELDFRCSVGIDSPAGAMRVGGAGGWQHAPPWRAPPCRPLPQRCVPPSRLDRRVELSGRDRSAVVCSQGRVREMRRTWSPHRCAPELERAARAAKPDRQWAVTRITLRSPNPSQDDGSRGLVGFADCIPQG